MTLTFLREAERELRQARDHYEAEREGLGLELVRDVELLAARIAAGPLSFPSVEGTTIRRALCKRFPYMLVFEVRVDDSIRVLAVAHRRRQSGYWRGRGRS